MTNRPILYGADGDPIVVDVGPTDRNIAILVEAFGALIGWDGKPPHLATDNILAVIADIVTPEVLMARYPGLQLEVERRPHASGRES